MRNPADPVNAATAPLPPAATSAGQLLASWSARAWAYDYFATLRRLESLAPELPRWGRALRPSAEPVRVAQEPSLSFAPAGFSRFEPADAHLPPRLRQHFFSYIGPNGPLPVHLSEFIRERALNHGDPTWLAFLDTFLHRFALQFYRAWAQARPVTGMDRPGEDAFRRQIGAFVGIGTTARQERDAVHDDARLHFSGWLARGVHSAEGVEAVVGAYFGVPVRLERWVGHWMRLPDGELTRVGASNPNAPSRTLGLGAVLGRQVWDRQHKVRLHLGPLTLAQYRRFLPIGDARPVLAAWMRQLVGEALDWDAELVLRQDEVPPTQLGAGASPGPAAHASRLGWTSWLGHRPRTRDARDVRISGANAAGPPPGRRPPIADRRADLQNTRVGSSISRSHP
ncbi:type VI secretion system baseplate subunit TssG [Xenophilus sp. Marseille-Q4582]|uniref:type VI secretion system baseplate subunit TssG n=1 Tax=Xenophilus sp. Marseille-Q4582 TaxID=2866600 RepID=UPI001CE42036|nr:type VI secretion system baseplate subunit TssG [Xenophilus sp. Marseille-Q4582]